MAFLGKTTCCWNILGQCRDCPRRETETLKETVMTTPPESKTPFTDAARFYVADYQGYLVSEHFVRSLELKLNEALVECEKQFINNGDLREKMERQQDKLNEALAQLAEAKNKWDNLQTLIKCDAHAKGKDTPIDVLDQLVKKLAEVVKDKEKAQRCLGFFASVIKSGESWTKTCQRDYDAALKPQQSNQGE